MSDPNIGGGGGKDAKSYGLVNGVWRKNPLLIGYSGIIEANKTDLSLAAGYNKLDGDPVPSGEIWVITHIGMAYVGTTPTTLEVQKWDGGNWYQILFQLAPVSGSWYTLTGYWILNKEQTISATVQGATLNDDLYLTYMGFSVDIDQ